jgi:hypothetical protein
MIHILRLWVLTRFKTGHHRGILSYLRESAAERSERVEKQNPIGEHSKTQNDRLRG